MHFGMIPYSALTCCVRHQIWETRCTRCTCEMALIALHRVHGFARGSQCPACHTHLNPPAIPASPLPISFSRMLSFGALYVDPRRSACSPNRIHASVCRLACQSRTDRIELCFGTSLRVLSHHPLSHACVRACQGRTAMDELSHDSTMCKAPYARPNVTLGHPSSPSAEGPNVEREKRKKTPARAPANQVRVH